MPPPAARTAILYGTGGSAGEKLLLIVSLETGEERSAVALNLAASFSLLGKRVAVVDANIRAPRLHALLGMENRVGLGDVLAEKADLTAAMQPLEGQRTPARPDRRTDAGKPYRTAQIRPAREHPEPVDLQRRPGDLWTARPSSWPMRWPLPARVDGVLLVLRPGKTRVETAQAALDYPQRAGGKILGVAFHRVPRRWAQYHEGFYFSYEDLARARR